jgi:site-specific recombinase XerD
MKKEEEEIIKEFLADCSQRLSPKTVKSHRTTLNALRNYLIDVNIIYATKPEIRGFLNDLKARKRARSTIQGRLASLIAFYNFVHIYHDIDTVNLSDINIKEYPRSRWEGSGTDALTRQEVRRLIDAPDNIRDILLISVLYYCGLRADEITRITLDDLDQNNRTLSILGKGNKPRKVPYATALDRIIEIWLRRERRSYVNSDGPYFFPSKHGEQLTPNAIHRIVYENAVKAGIQEKIGERGDGSPIYKVHPHVLRHSYATHAIMDDIPLNHVQQYMGHSSITTTLRYTGDIGIFNSYYKGFKGV